MEINKLTLKFANGSKKHLSNTLQIIKNSSSNMNGRVVQRKHLKFNISILNAAKYKVCLHQRLFLYVYGKAPLRHTSYNNA